MDSSDTAREVKRLVRAAESNVGEGSGMRQGIFDVSHNTATSDDGELAFMPMIEH